MWDCCIRTMFREFWLYQIVGPPLGIHYNWSWANVTPTCWCNVAPMSKIALGWCYFSHWAHISDYFGQTLDQNKLAIWEGVVRYISDRNFTLLQFWTTELILVMITYIIIYKIKLFHFQTQDWSIILLLLIDLISYNLKFTYKNHILIQDPLKASKNNFIHSV